MTEAPIGKLPSIRPRVALTVGSAFLLLFAVLYFALSLGMEKQLAQRESADMHRQAQMAEGLLHASVEYLPAVARDLSRSEAMYASLSGEEGNAADAIKGVPLDTYRLNFAALLGADGTLLAERFAPDAAVPEGLSTLYARVAPEAFDGGYFGFFSHNGQVLYVSASPALRSDGSGPAAGLLLLGRVIDAEELLYVARSAAFSFSIVPLEEVGLTPDRLAQIEDSGSVVFAEGDTVCAYGAMVDAGGERMLLMKTESPRTLYRQGSGFTGVLLLIVAACCAVMAVAVIALLGRIVVSPLARLARDVNGIDVQKSVASVHSRGGGEIASLAVAFNGMLSRIRASRETIEKKDRELYYHANFDALTGLRNRRSTIDLLGESIEAARAQNEPVSVFFFDLDRFKYINDTLGHGAGDRFIQLLADRLREGFQEKAFVGRMGGDEFVIIARDIHTDEVRQAFAKRIIDVFAEPFTIRQRQMQVDVSVGASIYPEDGLDAETLIKNAEIAMFRAKENGDGLFVPYRGEMQAEIRARIDIENRLRCAIADGFGEFRAFIQPKVNVKTGEVIGGEALLRWVTHDGVALPIEFIPQAEDSGLIIPLSWWMIRECCRMGKEFERHGFFGTISINVTAQVLFHENFLPVIREAVRDTDMDYARLDIEIVEGTLVEDFDKVNEVLRVLHELGMQVSVDDFGTGYSSLSYLSKMAIDRLKIDRSFVSRIDATKEDRTIVDAIIAMGKRLKLIITAEGVEEEAQYAFLKDAQCDEVQGFLISRPLTAEEFIRFVVRQRSMQMHAQAASGK